MTLLRMLGAILLSALFAAPALAAGSGSGRRPPG